MNFNADFYPTPAPVIEIMLRNYEAKGKIFFEPEAGKCDIVDFLYSAGAREVIACENDRDLQRIVKSKCNWIAADFLTVTSEKISHIDAIIMNPPFSADETHIIHAYTIAPAGCEIRALCNYEIYNNPFSAIRKYLRGVVDMYGSIENLGDCFSGSERSTGVCVGLIKIVKPGAKRDEFEGFYMDSDIEPQSDGIMPYNFVRDLVNRYIGAVKLFDQQIELGTKMNSLTSAFFSSKIAFTCTQAGAPKIREDYKKDLQKSAWHWVFEQMKMEKYTTKGLREDINKFVEKQTEIPFTMKNIYKMLEIVIGTTASRMDRAIIEVFDKLTQHHDDNRYNVEGWKTISHYLMGEKFILPGMTTIRYRGGMELTHYDHYTSLVEDMNKALCYLTGKNYDDIGSLWTFMNNREKPGTEGGYPRQYIGYDFNTWYDWGFFK